MIFTPRLLQQLEQNTTLKKGYLNAGSLGYNKLIALPVIITIASLWAAYQLHDLSRPTNSYTTYMSVCLALAAICIIAIVFMQRNAKKNVAANIDNVPVCIAKKIYGNDTSGVYYGIYTPGSRRHDIEFIEQVAHNIFNIDLQPDVALKNQINKIFEAKFAEPRGVSIPLPKAITAGEEVYQRQFSFNTAGKEMNNSIEENEGRFIVLAFNKTNAVQVRMKDILPYASDISNNTSPAAAG